MKWVKRIAGVRLYHVWPATGAMKGILISAKISGSKMSSIEGAGSGVFV